jgi:hypothetical protein
MNIRTHLKLRRSLGLIAYLLVITSFLNTYFHQFISGKTNKYLDLGISLGFILIALFLVFLIYHLELEVKIKLRDKAKSLDPKNYHFFMLDYHKSFYLASQSSIIKDLAVSAQKVLSPEDFEQFTLLMKTNRTFEKRKMANIILMFIFLIVYFIVGINYLFFVTGPDDTNFGLYTMVLICSISFLASFQSLPILDRLNADLDQRSN